MRRPNQAQLLAAWEAGREMPWPARAQRWVDALRSTSEPSASSLTMGQLDRLLMELHEAALGTPLPCVSTCSACGSTIEFELSTERWTHAPQSGPREFVVQLRGSPTRFRVPSVEDVDQSLRLGPNARAHMLERCRIRDGESRACTLEPGDDRIIAEAMAAADGASLGELTLACAVCDALTTRQFDAAAYVVSALDAWAKRLLRETHELALAYHWSERDILDLSPLRRASYLQLVRGVRQ